MYSAYSTLSDVSNMVTKIVASGITKRGPSSLCRDAIWEDAADLIAANADIAIVTGFYIPSASAPETDGPLGASVLARALSMLGKNVEVWTDSFNAQCVSACVDALPGGSAKVIDIDKSKDVDMPDLFIYLERLGRARDGRYYDMRKNDISEWVSPLDSYAADGSIPTIGIGDGGNEVGMAKFEKELSEIMPHYKDCLSTVSADVCIPVDVSNWGAYGLAAVLSARYGRYLGQTADEEYAIMRASLDAGAVDGVSKRAEMSVDGLDIVEHKKIASELERAFAESRR